MYKLRVRYIASDSVLLPFSYALRLFVWRHIPLFFVSLQASDGDDVQCTIRSTISSQVKPISLRAPGIKLNLTERSTGHSHHQKLRAIFLMKMNDMTYPATVPGFLCPSLICMSRILI
ncbi:hypothetical protein LFZ51_04225 [Salmonella enterica subsp. arizonae serovar 63:g,z51:- str. So 20/20]|nr:hypothetical protein LFZ51_04225 [Salmonella enterica subsp. arizonae serovar 63:g,z51:- str. So 20/20]